MQRRPTIMRRPQKHYGDVFTVRMPYGPSGSMVTVVALADPEHIRQVFAGPTDVFHAGEGNSSLLEVMGERSLLLLDEGQHVRARKLLLMPAFTGRARQGYDGLVTDLARSAIEQWQPGQEIVALERCTRSPSRSSSGWSSASQTPPHRPAAAAGHRDSEPEPDRTAGLEGARPQAGPALARVCRRAAPSRRAPLLRDRESPQRPQRGRTQ
jgi:cytochrome P450